MQLSLAQFGIEQLNPDQRLELIELIWDSLPETTRDNPPAWHLEVLQERLDEADAKPNASEP
ncbi:MAG: addiction module protein [Pirellulales bacterium]|nr:addiction module protein [Pirellulales bacterium]